MHTSAKIPHISSWYFALATLFFAIAVGFGMMQFQVMRSMQTAIGANEKSIADLEQETRAEEESYREVAKEYRIKREAFIAKMEQILPQEEGFTQIARLFDVFFASINRPGDVAEQNNLVFGQGAPLKDREHISVLPISMNIQANRKNFLKFLDFVESSGTLNSGIRLMDIKAITFNFPEGGELIQQPKQEVNFNVRMNAYYRTPKERE